jgi:hypothetical protein
MVKELQDAFVMATQQTIVKEVEKRVPKSK